MEPTYGRSSVGQPARTYLHQLCSGAMDDWDRWKESGKSILSAQFDKVDDPYQYRYILLSMEKSRLLLNELDIKLTLRLDHLIHNDRMLWLYNLIDLLNGWLWFYGMSTLVGYLISNPVHMYMCICICVYVCKYV